MKERVPNKQKRKQSWQETVTIQVQITSIQRDKQTAFMKYYGISFFHNIYVSCFIFAPFLHKYSIQYMLFHTFLFLIFSF